ncbi:MULTISPECIES: fimbrillin family protein [Bacteroides]|uniref:fimbrillin family protein n=1 Tax=Bacteroides TaxID=816 RepID=UPI00319D8819
MKYYNYISILLFVSFSALTSCTQDDNMGNEASSTQNFQISVSETGFESDNTTRATENNYSTIFVNGDAIGIFAVRNGAIVSNINNVKCTMQDGAWEMETNIEYKESEFKKMSFYAYYPYNGTFNSDTDFDASKTLTDGDPFEGYVANWKVDAEQDEANYTKYDLMTSVGKASGQRLKGEVSFVMQHRMALAVLQMPDVVYDFTNTDVTIDDYILPTQAGSFKLNNKIAKPYEQEINSKTYYRFLVNPNKEFTIAGSYITSKEEKTYDHTATLTSGQAKLYKVKNPDTIKQQLSVGDYLCADGSIISKDAAVPENAIGVIFYVGNPQPSVTHADKYVEAKDPLRRDYPECKHGLVLALKNALLGTAEKGRFNTSNKHYYGTWFRTDEKYMNSYVDTERGKNVAPIAGFQGYNNTVLMEVGATMGDDYKAGAGNALTALENYRTENATPTTSTGWYFPSDFDLITVKQVVATVNSSIEKANGTVLVINDGATEGGSFYWSNTERNNEWLWANTMGSGSDASGPAESGSLTAKRYASNNDGFFRMMLAF